jgi:hypothetical protein
MIVRTLLLSAGIMLFPFVRVDLNIRNWRNLKWLDVNSDGMDFRSFSLPPLLSDLRMSGIRGEIALLWYI